jgi:hypothetical protein
MGIWMLALLVSPKGITIENMRNRVTGSGPSPPPDLFSIVAIDFSLEICCCFFFEKIIIITKYLKKN